MNITQSREDNVLILRLYNRLDANNIQNFGNYVKEIIQGGEKKILFNLSNLDYMSSAGLRILTLLQAIMMSSKGTIAICSPNENMQDLFQLVQLEQIYKIFESKDEALLFLSTK